MSLPDQWEVEKAYIDTNTGVFHIEVHESDKFLKGLTCEKCGGPYEITGHEKMQTWSYPDTLGNRTVVESELPKLRCKKCGAIPEKFPVRLPWEDKGKLLKPEAMLEFRPGWSLQALPYFIPTPAAG
jgi:hypothetical protein